MSATIYTTPTCPYCTMAKQWLEDRGVTVIMKDATKDVNRREMEKLTKVLQVPVIRWKGKTIVGFDIQQLESMT